MVYWVAVWERPPIQGHHDGCEVLSDKSSSENDPSVRASGGRCVVPRVYSQRRVRSEGSDPGHLTLIDSSDEDAPFVVPARPSRILVLVPESADATPQSIQDQEWDTRLDSAGPTGGEWGSILNDGSR